MKAGLKTILLSALSTFAAFSAVTYNSCTSDKCKSIVCAYNGSCKEGTCICQSGYEGPQCETVIRDRYRGSWSVAEKGSFTRAVQYTATIEYGPTMTDLVIHNFYNKLDVKANISRDTIIIPQQDVNGYVVIGRGILSKTGTYGMNGEIIMRYTVREPNGMTNDFGTTGDHDSAPSIWSH